MTVQTLQNAEPIPGYTIQERIGAGGYGEVWSANAPGGLSKAIKFVYGYLDDVRASAELKALKRIKEVRHPFLLSLERIEVVEGQLLIVTELADGCLKDCFNAHQEAGGEGIPREELLVYMGDAADALDYMDANYSLQHLDIKPENLLLVGGRVKVADFGLVKDLHDHTVSLMGGLTPVYAPPEVFDGKPTHFSDQYSLAIVYQELLSGVLPFPGKTAAQLAAQHLHGRPRLASIPEPDRPVIARALSKDPQQRFPTCRELVDRLIEAGRGPSRRGSGGEARKKVMANGKGKAKESQQADPRDEDNTSSVTQIQPVNLPGAARAVITDLPPIEWDAQSVQLRPTLFVGIGGAAALTLQRLRLRLHDRFDGLDRVPAVRMLLLDTDRKALYQATQGEERMALAAEETLDLPLRRTQEYRRDSKKFLQWLSRRWLYNIPRSQETEGLRPLGRLAFVDHYAKIQERVSAALRQISDPEAAQATADTVGYEFLADSPRVVLVASIAGGTGSGMVLDMAYAARATLQELGLADDRITGMLMYGTPRKANARELAMVNAYACLNELNHYASPEEGYPGDAACGLGESDLPPFQDSYLVHLGEESTDEEFCQSADEVAEYLYRDVVTPAGSLLETCRSESRDEVDGPDMELRTFGLHRLGCTAGDVADAAAELLCRAVTDHWQGEADTFRRHRLVPTNAARPRAEGEMPAPLTGSDVTRLAAGCADALGLDTAKLRATAEELIAQALGKSPAAHFATAVQQFLARRELSEAAGDGDAPVHGFFEAVDRVLGPRWTDESSTKSSTALQKAWKRLTEPWIEQRANLMVHCLFQIAEKPGGGAQGAAHGAEWFRQHVKAIEEETREAAEETNAELTRLEQSLRAATAEGRGRRRRSAQDALEKQLLDYALRRTRDFALRGVVGLVQGMGHHAVAIEERFRDWRRELELLAEEFEAPEAMDEEAAERNPVPWAVAGWLQARLPELAGKLAAAFAGDYFPDSEDGFRELTTQRGLPARLPGPLRALARRAVRDALEQINVAGLLLEGPEDERVARVKASLGEAQPPLLTQCGGGRRLLVFAPGGPETEHLQTLLSEACETSSNSATGHGGDLVLCYESEGVSLDRAAGAVIQHRPDLPNVAARIRTRVDVQWKAVTEE